MSYGNNTNSPVGFKPYCYQNGALWTGGEREYPILSGYATSLFEGDPVTLLANGTIGIAAPGAAILGIFQGVTYVDTSGMPQYTNMWTGGTVTQSAANAYAKVVDDPTVWFDIQISTINNQPGPANPVALALANVNANANFAIATAANSFNPTVAPNPVTYAANPQSGNTSTGISAYFLDYNSIANTTTLNCKIMGITPVVGNVYSAGGTASGTINFNNVLVRINNHILSGGTGTAGV
jgi:hypothetical protein